MSLKSLKSSLSIENLNKKISDLTPQRGGDDRYWYPTRDKSGNGYAVVRFLPAPEGEETPFVLLWTHSFQHPDTQQYYIENSRTTLGQDNPDPVGEYNQKIWNTGIKENQEFVRKYTKRRLHYISNVYVVKDPANPENEGKVFLYKYGKKIFDKLKEAMNPSFEDEAKINPFDPWKGANFKIKIKTVERFPNYDASEFDKPAPLFENDSDDKKLEKVYDQEYSLQAEVSEDKFKSYEQLQRRFNKVMGLNDAPVAAAQVQKPKASTTRPQTQVNEVDTTANDVETLGGDSDDDEFMSKIKAALSEED